MTSTAVQLHRRLPLATDRLLVTVRDPHTRAYRAVGFLNQDGDRFGFAYLRREVERENFRPLPGLRRAAHGRVWSDTLFPLFAERVVSSRRPDRHVSLDALGLPFDAAPMEVLARSQGQRVGDTVELLPAPIAGPGAAVAFTFLTHGVRYLSEAEQERIASLILGERLRLRLDADNPVNPRAQVVTDTEDVRLGWLPDPLISLMNDIADQQLSVERSSGPQVGFHFRLLARLQGRVTSDTPLFAGPYWETI